MDQVFDILDTQDHLGDAPDAVVVMELKGAVEFEDVHFALARPVVRRSSTASIGT